MSSRIDGNGSGQTPSTSGTSSGPAKADKADQTDQTTDAQQMGPVDTSKQAADAADSESFNLYREAVYGQSGYGNPSGSGSASGSTMSVRELQESQQAKTGLSDRQQDLKGDLNTKTSMIRNDTDGDTDDWEGEVMYIDRDAADWTDHYQTRNFYSSDSLGAHDGITKTLVDSDGNAMSDSQIAEVVDKHRSELEADGAFEGWTDSHVDTWEKGVNGFLKAERARAQVDNFKAEPADVPSLAYDLDERSVDNPGQIRQELDNWEDEQLARFDKVAEQAGADGDDASNDIARDRIKNARDMYEKLAVGDSEGNEYALPEQVEYNLEGDKRAIRAVYVQHLKDNPGDIEGAYEAIEDKMDYANRSQAANSIVGVKESIEAK